MKAVMVFNVEDVCKNCVSRIILHCKGWEDRHKECPWKPLPQKSTYELADDHPFTKAEIMAYTYGITVGRNQVIEEITDESNISG